MNPHPKHYLADVPQELRLRVLDLCIHRQWHDALDLLHQNGFTQYEWYELVWFHDHAPTNLSTGSTGDLPVSVGDSPTAILLAPEHVVPPGTSRSNRGSGGKGLPASRIQEPASEPESLTPETLTAGPNVPVDPNLNATTATTATTNLNASPVKVPKPRSKIARLPAEIQLNLNTMLAAGCSYTDIIRHLNDHGYPGFNKVNLHDWKLTGFQNWLRTHCADT